MVPLRGPGDAARLDALAQGGLWRTWLDQRVTCAAPQATTLAGGIPARLLACTRRNGGWPHVALVAAGPDGPVLADGVATATPVMERLAIGQASAAGANQARSAALEIALRRMAAAAFSGNDVGRYEELMNIGRELNQAENFAAAEDAYQQYVVARRLLVTPHPRRVAGEHCCSPAPSERHVNLSAYAAQASLKAPRGTRWGAALHLHDTGLGLTSDHAGGRTSSEGCRHLLCLLKPVVQTVSCGDTRGKSARFRVG